MAIARVQSATGSVASGPTYTVTFGAPPTNGNTILLGFACNSGAIASISQTGVTWTQVSSGGVNEGVGIWIGVVGPGAGTVATVTQPTGRGVADAVEFSGILAAGSTDQTPAVASGNSAAMTTPSLTPPQSGELIFAVGVNGTSSGGTGPTNSYVADANSPAASAFLAVSVAYLVQGAGAATSTAWTITSGAWDAIAASFIAASGGGGGGGGGSTLVQKNDNQSASTGSLVVTLPGVTTAGNTLIVAVVNNNGFVTSITGGGVTTWAARKRSGVTEPTEIWSGLVDTTPSAAVTVNVIAASRVNAKVMEWTGALTVDVTNSASGSSVTPDSGSVTPTQTNDLVVAAVGIFATISAGPTGGFTDQGINNGTSGSFGLGVGTLLETSIVAADATWTAGSSGWDGVIVAFKTPTGGGGGGTPTYASSGIWMFGGSTDGARGSAHKPPWFLPMMKHGRLNGPSTSTVPNLGGQPPVAPTTGTGGSAFGFSSAAAGSVAVHAAVSSSAIVGGITAETADGTIRAVLGQIGTPALPDYGLKVVSPGSINTIIDGVSDVFKVAATGTLSVNWPPGANSSATVSVTLTALGSGFSKPPALLSNSYGSFGTERYAGFFPVVIPGSNVWGADSQVTIKLVGGVPVVTLYADNYGASMSAYTAFCRFWVLIEVGV